MYVKKFLRLSFDYQFDKKNFFRKIKSKKSVEITL